MAVGEVSVRETGRRGGAVTLAKYGREHFVAISKKGKEALLEKYGPRMAMGKFMSKPLLLCQCGCGESVSNRRNSFIFGHQPHPGPRTKKIKGMSTRPCVLTVRLSETEHQQLTEMAAKDDGNKGAIVRRLIREAIIEV